MARLGLTERTTPNRMRTRHNSRMGSCFQTKNGKPCIETNLWRCQHVHKFKKPRYTEGPYKGLTYEQAKAVYEWHVRNDELTQRLLEHSKKSRAIARALVASADKQLSLILSAFKRLSPEQLESARHEALKTLPAAEVEIFFDDLANHSTTMTPEQIREAEKEMISARKLLWIANDKLNAEFEQLDKEIDEHERNYPQY